MAQAVYRINDFILYKMATELQYTGSGIKPIFPAQQTPESNALSGPFLVYNYRTTPLGDEWWRSVGEVNYIIYSTDMEETSDIAEKMTDIFRRMDETATELNNYLISQNKKDFIFYYTKVMSQLSPTPPQQEGGDHLRLLTIRYEYSKASGTGIS